MTRDRMRKKERGRAKRDRAKDREGERVDNAEPSVPPNYTAVQTHANPENKLYLLCKLAAYWRTERTGFVTTRVRDGGGERGWNLRGMEARSQPRREAGRMRESERKRERESIVGQLLILNRAGGAPTVL